MKTASTLYCAGVRGVGDSVRGALPNVNADAVLKAAGLIQVAVG